MASRTEFGERSFSVQRCVERVSSFLAAGKGRKLTRGVSSWGETNEGSEIGEIFASGKAVKIGGRTGLGSSRTVMGSGMRTGAGSCFAGETFESGGEGKTGGSVGSIGVGGDSCRRRPRASSRSPKSPNSSWGGDSRRGAGERPLTGGASGCSSSCPCRFLCIHHCARLARTKRMGTSHSTAEGDYFGPGLPESLAMAARISVSAETLRIF